MFILITVTRHGFSSENYGKTMINSNHHNNQTSCRAHIADIIKAGYGEVYISMNKKILCCPKWTIKKGSVVKLRWNLSLLSFWADI